MQSRRHDTSSNVQNEPSTRTRRVHDTTQKLANVTPHFANTLPCTTDQFTRPHDNTSPEPEGFMIYLTQENQALSPKHLLHHIPMHIRQTEIPSLEPEGQAGMIHPQ